MNTIIFQSACLATREKQQLVPESFSAIHIYKSDHLQPLRTGSQKISIYYLLIPLSL
jgi:hypothetical protein